MIGNFFPGLVCTSAQFIIAPNAGPLGLVRSTSVATEIANDVQFAANDS